MFLVVDRAFELIKSRYSLAPITYDDIIRVENYPYPRESICEALINAISNADYGSDHPITVTVQTNKLTIQNPGGLLYGYTLKEITKHQISMPRNMGIATVFHTAGMSETPGRGFDKMNRPYKEQNVVLPRYRSDPHEFFATFVNIVVAKGIISRDMNGRPVNWNGWSIPEGLSDNERLVFKTVADGEFDSIRSVSTRLALSHGVVERALKSLTNKGLIERIGSDRYGSWIRV